MKRGQFKAETEYALALLRTKQVKTPYEAAKLSGIALSTIYRALKRLKPKS